MHFGRGWPFWSKLKVQFCGNLHNLTQGHAVDQPCQMWWESGKHSRKSTKSAFFKEFKMAEKQYSITRASITVFVKNEVVDMGKKFSRCTPKGKVIIILSKLQSCRWSSSCMRIMHNELAASFWEWERGENVGLWRRKNPSKNNRGPMHSCCSTP